MTVTEPDTVDVAGVDKVYWIQRVRDVVINCLRSIIEFKARDRFIKGLNTPITLSIRQVRVCIESSSVHDVGSALGYVATLLMTYGVRVGNSYPKRYLVTEELLKTLFSEFELKQPHLSHALRVTQLRVKK